MPFWSSGKLPFQAVGLIAAKPGGAAPPAALQASNFPKCVRTPALASTCLVTVWIAAAALERVVST